MRIDKYIIQLSKATAFKICCSCYRNTIGNFSKQAISMSKFCSLFKLCSFYEKNCWWNL